MENFGEGEAIRFARGGAQGSPETSSLDGPALPLRSVSSSQSLAPAPIGAAMFYRHFSATNCADVAPCATGANIKRRSWLAKTPWPRPPSSSETFSSDPRCPVSSFSFFDFRGGYRFSLIGVWEGRYGAWMAEGYP